MHGPSRLLKAPREDVLVVRQLQLEEDVDRLSARKPRYAPIGADKALLIPGPIAKTNAISQTRSAQLRLARFSTTSMLNRSRDRSSKKSVAILGLKSKSQVLGPPGKATLS